MRRPILLRASAALATLILLWGAGAVAPLSAKVFLTQEEALKLAFPGAAVAHRTAFLTAAQQKDAQKLSGQDLPAALVKPLRRDFPKGGTRGRHGGHFDTSSDDAGDDHGRHRSLRRDRPHRGPLVFDRRSTFRPRWYEQFAGKSLNDELDQRAIHP